MRFLQVAPNQPNAVIPKLKAVTDDVAESMLLITPRASHLVPKPYGLMCVATVPAQGSLLRLFEEHIDMLSGHFPPPRERVGLV